MRLSFRVAMLGLAATVAMTGPACAPAEVPFAGGSGSPLTEIPDGGLEENILITCTPTDKCCLAERGHDVNITKAARWLDYARSFHAPPTFRHRKAALFNAKTEIQYALLGGVGALEYWQQYGIIPQLKGVTLAFEDGCTAVAPQARVDRYYAKLAHLVALLSEVTQELIEMDLAEADQAVGLYQGYAEARDREWRGFKAITDRNDPDAPYVNVIDPDNDNPAQRTDSLLANGSRNVALERLLGVPQSIASLDFSGGGNCYAYPPDCEQTGQMCYWICSPPQFSTSYQPTGLALVNPCTVDPTEPDIKRALQLRKRFDFGRPADVIDDADERQRFCAVVNAVLNAQRVRNEVPGGGAPVNGVPIRQYTCANDQSMAKLFSDYGTTAEAFRAAGVYLDEEAWVVYRDAPTSTLAGESRPSILSPPVSYGLVKQYQARSIARARFAPQASGGLRNQLADIRSQVATLEPSSGSNAAELLRTARQEINTLIGERTVQWKTGLYSGSNPPSCVQLHTCIPCTSAGDHYVQIYVDATPEEMVNLRVFYGTDNWARAMLGRFHGLPGEPQVAAGDSSNGRFSESGILDMPRYVMCNPPSDPHVYLLNEGKYQLLDAADLSETWALAPVDFENSVGGILDEMALRITERSPNNCGEAKYTSIGLPRDLVPPLENELTDTGKPYEDSFAYYLNLADQAANEAFTLADQARKAEVEILNSQRKLQDDLNNLAADAQDEISQICGTTPDANAGCSVQLKTVAFGTLNMLGAITCDTPSGSCCGGGVPEEVPPTPTDTDAFVTTIGEFVNGQANCIMQQLNAIELELPVEFENDGTLDPQERGRYGGEFLVTLLDVDKDLHAVARIAIGMKGSVQAYQEHLQEMRSHLDQLDNALRQYFISSLAALGRFCSASANSWTSFGAAEAGASMTFAAEIAQAELNLENGLAAQEEALSKYRGDAESFVTGLQQQSEDLKAQFTDIAQVVTKLKNQQAKQEQIRNAADRHARSASFLSDTNNPLKRTTFTREAERARRALTRSKMMSFIARRAVEFKLVKNLSKETGTDPFVEPPKRWADSIFAASHAGDPETTDTWADSTVGYVQKLRDYVTAYPFLYPFQDGEDWAVISLRDDYLRPTLPCFLSVARRNLLPYSEIFSPWWTWWQANNGITPVLVTDPASPLPSSFATALTIPSQGGAIAMQVPATDGTHMTISAWLRSDSSFSPGFGVKGKGEGPPPPERRQLFPGDGTWHRRSWTFAVDSTTMDEGNASVTISIGALDSGTFYVVGAQLEVGTQAGDYERAPSSKNLLPWSEWFALWDSVNASVQQTTYVPGPSPDALASVVTTSQDERGLYMTVPAVPGTTMTMSAWILANPIFSAGFSVMGKSTTWTPAASQIFPGDGTWHRRTWTFAVDETTLDPGNATVTIRVGAPSPTMFYLYGTQLELGSQATDYEPTPAALPQVLDTAKCVATAYDEDHNPTAASLRTSARAQLLRDSFEVKCVNDSVTSPANTDCSARGGLAYYQLPFSFSIADVESGKIIKDFQIAVGNYNYRVQDAGLNFVGSNVKDCELDDVNREACYANMFLPYSLSQDGHVQLRDHNQQILEFGMPSGQINSAKGIAAERYLTIPLSSTDQAAIAPYLKKEFRGRPLEGSYVLRVHAVPSLAWDNLEDIQLLIHYRYWTAFGQ
jgi:hypothetical protein